MNFLKHNILLTLVIMYTHFVINLVHSLNITNEVAENAVEPEFKITPRVEDGENFPENCSQRQEKILQHKYHKNARLKKCCPIGEGLNMNEMELNGATCVSTSRDLHMSAIDVTLYDNCIEDMESDIVLPFEIGNPCNESFLYNDADDIFFVMQDGSLLVMDRNANETYTAEKEYCVDIENSSESTYAIVCITSIEEHITRSNIVVVGVLMLISIPCLLLVSYVHLKIKELRSEQGIILSIMCACLATGYFLYSLVNICTLDENGVGYAVQFFILSYYFWFFCLCCNITINIWYYIPLLKEKERVKSIIFLVSYGGISFFGSLLFVILTYQKGLPGMPSYFIQGLTQSIRESQRYFIPPVSTLLLLSILTMTSSFFGLQKLLKQGLTTPSKEPKESSSHDAVQILDEVKKDVKCTSFLGIILFVSWILEIWTFYSSGPEIYLIFLDMINGLQGVFVLLIFLIVGRKRAIIFRWWNDSGSLTVENIELNRSML